MRRASDVSMETQKETYNIENYSDITLKDIKEAVRRMTFVIGLKMTHTSKHNHVLYNRICINLSAVAKHLENISEDNYE